ncbi:MAG: substrate-binding domain-containing protein [Actinomycetota bacterium]
MTTPDTPIRRRSTWLRLVALLMALGLVAAACGDSDDDAESSDTASASASEPAEETDDTEAATDDTEAGDMAGASWEGVEGDVIVSGSSTVEPVSTRAAELLADVNGDIRVTVDGPGTGDGFELFCNGETDISGASRAIKDEEAENCAGNGINFVELQVAFDGIAILTNPNNPVECVTFNDMYGLMSAEAEAAGVSEWADAANIADLELSQELPAASLDISAPGTESGTYDSFIEIVLEDIADERGQEDLIRTDFPGQAEDNVIVQGIAGSDSSFGWVGFAFAEANADVVKKLQVDGGSGCTEATFESIADGSYPVSRALYVYVNVDKAAENPAVTGYVDFYLHPGAYEDAVVNAFGEGAGYIPLPDDLFAETLAAWEGR